MVDSTKKTTDEKEERPWAQAWLRNESLEALNRRIHGRDAVDTLYEGARGLHETATGLWPEASPGEGDRVLDFGSGVGWPMQAGMDLFPGCHFTGLDISESMVTRAKERLAALDNAADYEGRYDFQLYDGTNFPFEDDTFDFIYSYRVLWHIPEHHLFPILKEMARVLKPGGAVVVHFLPFQGLTLERMLAQCRIQKENRDAHYLYYHTYQKIHWWICKLLRCTDFDIRLHDTRVWIHFGKGGTQAVRNEDFAKLMVWLERTVAGQQTELNWIESRIPFLRREVERHAERIAVLQGMASGRAERIELLQRLVAERGERIATLVERVAQRNEQISALEKTVTECEERLSILKGLLAKQRARSAARGYTDERVATLEAKVALRDEKAAELQADAERRDQQIAELGTRMAERDRELNAVYGSASWKITKPLRGIKAVSRSIAKRFSRQPAV